MSAPGFPDGVYKLSYAASEASESGWPELYSALAVLNGTTILGSDPHGALLSGELRFDASRNVSALHLRIRVPAAAELVTGACVSREPAEIEIAFDLPVPAAGTAPAAVVTVDVAGAPLEVALSYVAPLPGTAHGPLTIDRKHEQRPPRSSGPHRRRARAAR